MLIITILGAVSLVSTVGLFFEGRPRGESTTSKVNREIQQVSSQARSRISNSSEQYLNNVRDNARRK